MLTKLDQLYHTIGWLHPAQMRRRRPRLPCDRASTGQLLDLPESLGGAMDQTYSPVTAKLAGVSDRMLVTNGSPVPP